MMKRLLLALLFATSAAFAGDFTGTAGLQLYSLRDSFQKDVPGTLDKVKALGIKEVELAGTYGMTPGHRLGASGPYPVAGSAAGIHRARHPPGDGDQ